jgi:chloride channel protein, CIC family
VTERKETAPSPVTHERGFWVLIGYAVLLGVFGAFAALGSLAVIEFGARWGAPARTGWFGGHWWWVAVTVAAGVVVGLLRRLTHLPEEIPGLFDDLQTEYVDPGPVPGTVALSAVSLIGGASIGPEKMLASMGGGAGSWMARRRGLSKDDVAVNTLSGIAGMFGGLFSSPMIVVMIILEVARPSGQRLSKTLVTDIAAGSISFGIYFAIAGAVFLGTYRVPRYGFEPWHMLAAIPLGLFGALVTSLAAGFMMLASRTFGLMTFPPVLKSALGGLIFGLVGVALPLTMFSGGDQLASLLKSARGLGLGLCAAILVAKTFTYAVSQSSGFLGGPIFPSLFIGGTAGVVVHQAVPGIPLGLAFSCLLPAVLGTLAAAPFSMVLMAAFLTRAGALQSAPILIAVVTAFLGVEGVKYLRSNLDLGHRHRSDTSERHQ